MRWLAESTDYELCWLPLSRGDGGQDAQTINVERFTKSQGIGLPVTLEEKISCLNLAPIIS